MGLFFALWATTMLLVLIHQIDLPLQAYVFQALALEIQFDFLFQRIFADVAVIKTTLHQHTGRG